MKELSCDKGISLSYPRGLDVTMKRLSYFTEVVVILLYEQYIIFEGLSYSIVPRD